MSHSSVLPSMTRAYPGFAARFAVLTPAARAETLLFTVPDGRWSGAGRAGAGSAGGAGAGAADEGRVRATRAVLGYVQAVAAALPEVGRSLWAMGR